MLQVLLFIIIFLIGLAVGSFLNALIYRLSKDESVLSSKNSKLFGFARSYCPKCKHKLRWYDLIPVLSFIVLKGKCRYCHQKISWQYPLVELTTGILFLSIFNEFLICNQFSILNFQNWITTFYLFLISCFLIVIFVYDLKYYIIPDKIIFLAIGSSFLYRLFTVLKFSHWDLIENWKLGIGNFLAAAFGVALFFLVIILISKGRWMGFGDVKLGFFMGLFLGFPNILVALFLGFLLGAIIGIGLIILGKKTLKSEVPFGPFLVTGTFIAIFWGQKLINWYLNLVI